MSISHRRVLVMTAAAQVELNVPDVTTPADLIPQLFSMLSTVAEWPGSSPEFAVAARRSVAASPSGGWWLIGPGGRVLAADQAMSSYGLRDGDVLHLTAQPPSLPEPLLSLPGTRLPEPSRTAWSERETRLTFAAAAILLVLAAMLSLVLLPGTGAGRLSAALTAAAGWSGVGLVLSRWRSPAELRRWIGIALTLAAGPLWVLAAVAGPVPWAAAVVQSRLVLIAAAGLVALAVVAAAATSTWSAMLLQAGALLALPVIAVAAGAAGTGLPLAHAAGVLALVLVLLLRCGSAVAVRGGPLIARFGGTAGAEDRVIAEAMTAVLAATGTGLALTWSVLCLSVDIPALGHGAPRLAGVLLGLSAAAAACEPWTLRRRRHRVLATATAGIGLLALLILLLRGLPAMPAAGLCCLLGVVLLAGALHWRPVGWPPSLRRTAARLPGLIIAAMVPVLCLDLGAFSAVSTLAHGWVR